MAPSLTGPPVIIPPTPGGAAAGLVEVQEGVSTARRQYSFNSRVVAQRTLTSTSNTVVYLHGDRLGSTLILSRQDGTYDGQWHTP